MTTQLTKSPRVAFFGTAGGVSFAREGFDAALRKIGMNTGNMIFQYASWEALDAPKFCVTTSTDVAFIRENADVLFIPAANQVNPAFDLKFWADFVERVDLPVVIVGLGAQAPIGSALDIPLKEGTQRFLNAVSERTKTIGVRGQFTADVLCSKGIKNVTVTGCPSNFINPKINGKSIAQKLEAVRSGDVRTSCYVVGTMEPEGRRAEARLSSLARAEEADIVHQTNEALLKAIYTKGAESNYSSYLGWESSILWPEARPENYLRRFLEKSRFFSDARTWIDEAGKYSIVFGMRIHGTIAAIQGGGLGVCIAFDSRTEELASTMGYPYVHAKRIEDEGRLTVDRLAALASFCENEFDRKRDLLASSYRGVLEGALIPVKKETPFTKG